jgi:hypothetical protein
MLVFAAVARSPGVHRTIRSISMRTKITLAAACAACMLAMGCHEDNKQAMSKGTDQPAHVMASNEMCPFSGKAANQNVSSTYNGKTVHFCCNGCKAKFDAMSDADKAKMCAK